MEIVGSAYNIKLLRNYTDLVYMKTLVVLGALFIIIIAVVLGIVPGQIQGAMNTNFGVEPRTYWIGGGLLLFGGLIFLALGLSVAAGKK